MRLSTVALFGLLATAAQFAKADDLQDEIDQAQKKFCNGKVSSSSSYYFLQPNMRGGTTFI